MLTLLALTVAASAADPQPGLYLPGAAPMGQFAGSAGAGVFCNSATNDTNPGCGPVVQGSFGITKHLGIFAQVPFSLADGFSIADATFAARYNVVDVPVFDLAPFVLYSVAGPGGPTPLHPLDGLSVGLSARVGVPLVHVDAELVAFEYEVPEKNFRPPQDTLYRLSEAGVTVGPLAGNSIRLGISQLRPDVSYRFELPVFYVELGGTLNLDGGTWILGRLQVGGKW